MGFSFTAIDLGGSDMFHAAGRKLPTRSYQLCVGIGDYTKMYK